MKTLTICGIAAGVLAMLWGCNDKIDVEQDYDFSLSTMAPARNDPARARPVEIRFTLDKAGNYDGAEYFVGYIYKRPGKASCTTAAVHYW
ncbi:MAG: TraQ conjugal transfer family protein [Alistipes indistinctus]